MWQQYIQALLDPIIAERTLLKHPGIDPDTAEATCALMSKADLSGAKIEITGSMSPTMTSQSGIIAKETHDAYVVITEDDK